MDEEIFLKGPSSQVFVGGTSKSHLNFLEFSRLYFFERNKTSCLVQGS